MSRAKSKAPTSPLEGLVFCISGKLSMPRKELEQLIVSNGGAVATTVTAKVTHLISTPADSATAKYKDAEAKNLPIVDESFVHERIAGTKSKSAKTAAPKKAAAKKTAADDEPKPKSASTKKATKKDAATDDDAQPKPTASKRKAAASQDSAKPKAATTKGSAKTKAAAAKDSAKPKAAAAKDSAKPKAAAAKKEPTTSRKRAAPEAAADGKALDGFVFCISGKLSMPRKELEQLIVSNGGAVATTVTAKVTHLISTPADSATAKYKDAEAKNLPIVDESFVHERIAGTKSKSKGAKAASSSSSAAASSSSTATKKARTSKAASSSSSSSSSPMPTPGLEGLVFCITGKLSKPRAQIKSRIEQLGGSVATSITAKVTHLLTGPSDDDSEKRSKAEEKGLSIVDESFLEKMANRPMLTVEQLWKSTILEPDASLQVTITDAEIAAAEKKCGYKLPAAYIRLCRIQNGGSFVNTRYPTYQETSWSSECFAVDTLVGIGGSDGIESSKELIDEWDYPKNGLVLAQCPSGGHDIVMLDYSLCGAKGEPRVIYWDEDKTTVVAPNLEKFLAGLRPESEFPAE